MAGAARSSLPLVLVLVLGALLAFAAAAARPTVRGGAPCASALDCQLNGRCAAGACACNAGWTGATCAQLFVLPAKLHNGYGVGGGSGLSSWGAGVVRDPLSGMYVMQVDEMSRGCGLQTWGRNSQCVLAQAESPLGPFARVQTLLDAWCHGSTPARDPLSGRWLFQHMGNSARNQNCTECGAGGVTPPNATEGPCDATGKVPYTEGAFVSVGSDPVGPYALAPLVIDGANCENFFLSNGTLFVACPWGGKSTVPDCGSPSQNAFLTVSRAESLDAALAGEYTHLAMTMAPAGSSAPSEPLCVNWEDQTLFIDRDGHFHAVMHAFRGQNTSFPAPGCHDTGAGFEPAGCTSQGGHAFSNDGAHWWISPIAAYEAPVLYEDGSVVPFRARERPHFILSAEGDLTHFVSAVGDPGPGGNTGVPGHDHTFTLVVELGN